MKRHVLLLALILAAALIFASADVIWEPMDDFFSAHERECMSTDDLYEAAKDTYLYEQPDGKAIETISAGKTAKLSYTWQNEWGALDWRDGWIRLSDFRRLYDADDFAAEHQHLFVKAYGSVSFREDSPVIAWEEISDEAREQLGALPEQGAYDVNLWSYPGSGSISSILYSANISSWGGLEVGFSSVYQDDDGRLWIYISTYFYGHREGWVCLSDMSNAELPYTGRRYADESAAPALPDQTGGSTNASSDGLPPLALPIAAVALVSLATAALLVLLKKKDRAADPSQP